MTCVLVGEDALRKIGSVGKPVSIVAVRIVDDDMKDVPPGEVGEIVYRGPSVVSGYQKSAGAWAFRPVVKADGPSRPQAGRFCCSMYWRRTEIGAPPTEPAKYEPDHSRLARQ